MARLTFLMILLALCFTLPAQRSKVQSAWRALTDYEESLKEGRPDPAFLAKASDAIEVAMANEDSKKMPKAHAYRMRISYAKFRQSLADEIKRLEPTVPDNTERNLQAYGNIGTADMDAALEALNTLKDLDPRYLERIQSGLQKGAGNLDEEEMKFALAAQQMKMEAANIASGKFKMKKYDVAADYFYRSAVINSVLYAAMDTTSFYNACVAAAKSKSHERVLDYNNRMIEAKIAMPYNYESIYNAHLAKGDTLKATAALKKGREAFPEDVSLLTHETNLYLGTGRQKEALENLKVSIRKDPQNALYHFIIGNIYDNLANPKDKTGAEKEKPSDFAELFASAESNYLRAIELKPANSEYLYNSHYNLGAMYNNYGGHLASRKVEKGSDAVKKQRENESKALEYYKKAIPHLELALSIKPEDKVTMTALRKLYLLTGSEAKAKAMSERIKAQ
jgi:Tfp pilus assembly protein PilF